MRGPPAALTIWFGCVLLAGLIAARAHYTADLSAFLPRTPSKAQSFLVEELREGLVGRLILIDIEGADRAARARLSRELARRLRADGAFRAVRNGEAQLLERDRDFLVKHRYLLSQRVTPALFTPSGLRAALADGIDLLSSSMGLLVADSFPHDPTAEALEVIQQFASAPGQPRAADGIWVSRDGTRAVLAAETRALGSDTDAQAQAVTAIQLAFAAAQLQDQTGTPRVRAARLRLSGPGVFAVEARGAIERQALGLSLLSSLLIAAFLLAVYRSLRVLLLGLLPVVSGALAGVAAVALGFGVIHGVTLGFGVTLIGEAVDYSVYLFLQSPKAPAAGARSAAWITNFWPTVRLGMWTSICGFASLLPSAFPGLAQLGLYSIAGLLAAGLTTRYVLPALLPSRLRFDQVLNLGRILGSALKSARRLRSVLWLTSGLALVTLYVHREGLWNRELSALSPVPAAEQALDAQLRADLGAPDVRSLIVLSGKDPEAVLAAGEELAPALESLIAAGELASFQSPGRYLPSRAAQRRRQASLPIPSVLAANLAAAALGLPLQAERLRPFMSEIEAARVGPVLTRGDLEGTSMAAVVDALLVRHGDDWSALLPLQSSPKGPQADPIDIVRVRHALSAIHTEGVEVTVLDLKEESDAMYAGYLSDALRLSALGFAAIVLLLAVSLRSVGRVLRVLAPLLIAVITVMTSFALAGRALTILHLIGLLLIVAVGSNYALFFDRDSPLEDLDGAARLLASLCIANCTTVIAFGALAFSTMPVLAALGRTVAPGALLALILAAALSRPAEPAPASASGERAECAS
jgi:predicted exporter